MRRAGGIEVAAWVLGCSLLTSYGAARLLSEAAHKQGLDEFRRARAAAAETLTGVDHPRNKAHVELVDELPDALQPAAAITRDALDIVMPVLRFEAPPVPVPDTSSWSSARISAYFSTRTAATATAASGGTPEAILRIESIGLEVPVYAGTEEWNLNRGAGRIEGTPPVGGGNTGIAAHRDGYFRALGDVRIGDEISVETLNESATFRVTKTQIVRPEDVHVLAPTDTASVTLVTCYPFYFVGPAPMRYIVTASSAANHDEGGIPVGLSAMMPNLAD